MLLHTMHGLRLSPTASGPQPQCTKPATHPATPSVCADKRFRTAQSVATHQSQTRHTRPQPAQPGTQLTMTPNAYTSTEAFTCNQKEGKAATGHTALLNTRKLRDSCYCPELTRVGRRFSCFHPEPCHYLCRPKDTQDTVKAPHTLAAFCRPHQQPTLSTTDQQHEHMRLNSTSCTAQRKGHSLAAPSWW